MFKTTKISVVALLAASLMVACSGLSPATNSASALLNVPVGVSRTIALQGSSSTPASLEAYQATLEQIYEGVNPSVVNVDVIESAPAASQSFQLPGSPFDFNGPGAQLQQRALGSGFVWDNQGHIVTNNHVVDGASKITVTFSNGTTAVAKLVGADPNSDLAVIKVDVPTSNFKPVKLMDSNQVKVGQVAIAIGNPFGLSGTMTVGIISGLERSLPVGTDNSNFQQGPTYAIPDIIQTDASINPGNSGGVLVNDQGQLIGVTTAIESPTGVSAGIGFVIPSVIVQKVVPTLIKTGHYDHPWMGIRGATLTPDLAKANKLVETQQGALIIDVTDNSPSSKAGLIGSTDQVLVDGQQLPVGGDVIVAIDGQTVNHFEDMVSYIFENAQVGQTVTLTVLRDGRQKSIQLTLGTLPTQ